MRFIYADPGLVGEAGHHANSCREITTALRARGHKVTILAHDVIAPALAAELGAQPYFKAFTYGRPNNDPVVGWLLSFYASADSLAADLRALGPLGPETFMYFNSIQPAQLMGLRAYLMSTPPAQRPTICAEFGQEPGIDFSEAEPNKIVVRDPRLDPRATLYRLTACALASKKLPQLHLCTFDRDSSQLYRLLMELPVSTLPVPRFTCAKIRRRAAKRPITVGILGHQRAEKGYALVPAIIRQLLSMRADVHVLIHCADPRMVPAEHEQVRALAADEPRVTIDERTAGPALWGALLNQCDLILCPYDPRIFRAGYSAVTCEAVAHGIPLVVPARTTLSRTILEFGGGGLGFAEQTPECIAATVAEAVAQIDELAERAMGAAQKWRQTMGAGAMVDAMLAQLGFDASKAPDTADMREPASVD
jgi:glycosyltransferase involved in cell wall biosynthesis